MASLNLGVTNLRWSSIARNKKSQTSSTTSRKHCEKELQSFSHCGSFDHLDMQSLNDCIFFSFSFAAVNLDFFWHVIY